MEGMTTAALMQRGHFQTAFGVELDYRATPEGGLGCQALARCNRLLVAAGP